MSSDSAGLDDLTEVERRVVRAAATGELVDLTAGEAVLDRPELGAEWPENRAVRAGVLVDLLLGVGRLPKSPVRAVRVRGARISGELNLEASTLRCPLALVECYFEKALTFAEASAPAVRLGKSCMPGLLARQFATRGDLDLAGCAILEDGVDLEGARIGGQLICTKGKLGNPKGRALNAERIKVGGEVRLNDGFEALGELRLAGAQIGGQLICTGGKLRNPTGVALSGDGIQVKQGLFLDGEFEADGEVRLPYGNVGGQFICRNGKLRRQAPERRALVAEGLKVEGAMFLDGGFEADGEVLITNADIGGQLVCRGGKLRNPDDCALGADGIKVAEVFLDNGFEADGKVRLVGATIDRRLSFSGAQLRFKNGIALDLRNAVLGDLHLLPKVFDGGLDLTSARVSTYEDDAATWPTTIRLRDFVYERVTSSIPVGKRLEWIARNEGGYLPQIYDQLTATYRLAGREDDARKVAIEKQRARRAGLNLLGKLWGLLLDGIVGYGYRTWLAGVWLLGLLAIGTLIFTLAQGQLTAAKAAPEQPDFFPLVYTLDLLLPVVNLHQRDYWLAHGWLEGVVVSLSIMGWILATAVVLSISGILKRTE